MLDQVLARGPAIAAMLAALGLLLALQHVVRAGVERGEQWRQAVAKHAAATSRCQHLPGPEQRRDCLAGLARTP